MMILLIGSTMLIIPLQQEGKLVQAQTNDYKIYQNPYYAISMQLPSNWTINESERNSNHQVTYVATFLSPLEDSSDLFYENLLIGIHNLNYNNANLREFLHQITNSLIAGWKNLKIIDSNTNSMLAGNPAYKLVATYTQTQGNENEYDDIDVKMMEIGTIIGDKVYDVHYSAEPEKFDSYLPAIQKMVNSLIIDKIQDQLVYLISSTISNANNIDKNKVIQSLTDFIEPTKAKGGNVIEFLKQLSEIIVKEPSGSIANKIINTAKTK